MYHYISWTAGDAQINKSLIHIVYIGPDKMLNGASHKIFLS